MQQCVLISAAVCAHKLSTWKKRQKDQAFSVILGYIVKFGAKVGYMRLCLKRRRRERKRRKEKE